VTAAAVLVAFLVVVHPGVINSCIRSRMRNSKGSVTLMLVPLTVTADVGKMRVMFRRKAESEYFSALAKRLNAAPLKPEAAATSASVTRWTVTKTLVESMPE